MIEKLIMTKDEVKYQIKLIINKESKFRQEELTLVSEKEDLQIHVVTEEEKRAFCLV